MRDRCYISGRVNIGCRGSRGTLVCQGLCDQQLTSLALSGGRWDSTLLRCILSNSLGGAITAGPTLVYNRIESRSNLIA